MKAVLFDSSFNQEGSEAATRNYFDSEIKKWMAGETNTVSTMQSQIQSLEEPISYDIRSVVDGDPDFPACQDAANLPKDWETWPAYKLNVAIAKVLADGDAFMRSLQDLLAAIRNSTSEK